MGSYLLLVLGLASLVLQQTAADKEVCYTGRSDDYRGDKSTTRGGLTCQAWASQKPHKHVKYEPESKYSRNLCRGTDNWEPWCYTESQTRWDYCFDKQCVVPKTPTLSFSPPWVPVRSGTSVRLTCDTDSSGSIIYKFLRDNTVVYTGSSNTYSIWATTDSGTYTCVVTINDVDSLASSGRSINVAESDFSIRLIGGQNVREGNVEVRYLGRVGFICGHGWNGYGWSHSEARVACRMLGYGGASVPIVGSEVISELRGNVLLTDVRCSGGEISLVDCIFRIRSQGESPGFHCDAAPAAGVRCV